MKLQEGQYYVLSNKPYYVESITETGAHVTSLLDYKDGIISAESAVEIITERQAKVLLKKLKETKDA